VVRLKSPAPAAAPAGGEARELLGPLLAFVAVVALYARTLGYPLVWDDLQLVSQDPAASGWTGLWRALTSTFWGAYGRAQAQADFYRPVASVSLWLDRAFWGGRVPGFHLTGVLVAALGAALLVALLRRRGLAPVPAALAGLLFAAHPLHAESVPFVSDRTDLLALDFFLLFLLLWPARGEPWRPARAAGAAGALLLSLGSKEMALLAPVALAWDWWLGRAAVPNRRGPAPASAGRGAGRAAGLAWLGWLVAPIGLFLLARAAVLGGRASLPGTGGVGLEGVGATLLLYGRLLAWPVGACAEYGYPPEVPLPEALLGAAGWALLAGLAAWPRAPRQARWGAGLAVLFALPGALPGLAAARFLYFSSAFACVALVAVLEPVPRVRRVALAALALVFLGATWARVPVWRSNRALFEDNVRHSPRAPRAWLNLGVALEAEGRLDEAESALRRALVLQPAYDRAFSNLALVLRRQGRLGEAEQAGRRAVELEPANADAHFNLAVVLQSAGRPADAADQFRLGLEVLENPRARLGLAQALSEAGDHRGALLEYRTYLAAVPRDAADTRGSMAWELYRLGRLEAAEAEARAACAGASASPISHYNLGVILLASGREAEALDAYRRGLELDLPGAGWASAAGDVVDLIRAGAAPPAAHVALGLIAGRAGLGQARAREGARYLRSAPGGAWAALAAGWAREERPAASAAERRDRSGPGASPGAPAPTSPSTSPSSLEDLRRLLWGG
jgi:protein O-mannosyl-transferase